MNKSREGQQNSITKELKASNKGFQADSNKQNQIRSSELDLYLNKKIDKIKNPTFDAYQDPKSNRQPRNVPTLPEPNFNIF